MNLAQLAKALDERGISMRIQKDGEDDFVAIAEDPQYPSSLTMGVNQNLEKAIEEALKEWDELPDAESAEEEETEPEVQ